MNKDILWGYLNEKVVVYTKGAHTFSGKLIMLENFYIMIESVISASVRLRLIKICIDDIVAMSITATKKENTKELEYICNRDGD